MAIGGGYDGSIRIDTRVNTKGFNAGVKSMGNALKPLMAMIGMTFGIAIVGNFARGAVQAASQLSSAMIGLQSITDGMGMSFNDAQAFIKSYTEDGLIPATNAITAYKNLALRGYDTSQIEATMIALKDSAAFGRQASYTMGEAVQGATEGLKNENSILVDNAGVTKNVAKMWADWAKAHNMNVQDMTKEQKILAEVNGIMEETRFQTGDAAKATKTFAGQTSALAVSFLALKVAIGNAIIPVLTAIIPYVRAAIDWLTALFTTFAQFISILFGVEIAADAAGDGVGDLGAEAGDAGQDVGGAGKAAKGALAAFDELNVLAQDSGSGGGATPAPPPGGGDIGLPDPEQTGGTLDAMAEKVAAFKERMLTLLGPLMTAFGNLKASLMPLGETIWAGLKWAWDNILVPLGEWTITDLLPTFLDAVGEAGRLLNEILVALQPVGQWLWEEFLQPLGKWTGGIIVKIIEKLGEVFGKLADYIKENPEQFRMLIMLIGALIIGFKILSIVIPIVSAAATILGLIFSAIAASPAVMLALALIALIGVIIFLIKHWKDLPKYAQQAMDGIKKAFNTAWQWFKTKIVDPIRHLWKGSGLFDDIIEWAKDAWEGIKRAFNVALAWFRTNVTDPIRDLFNGANGLFTKLGEWAETAWGKVKTLFGTAATWFDENVIGPIQDGWDALWGGLSDGLSTVINTIIGFLNKLMGGVVSAINTVIESLNKIHITIPEYVAAILGFNSFGFNIAPISYTPIPELAKGAVIPPNARFTAILGDQRSGRNIEAPENLIRKIVREETQGMGTDVRISFDGSMGALIRELRPHIQKESRRIGKSLVTA